MAIIAPSILSADFLNLGRDIAMIEESQADWIHCDVMDGTFVPNISFGIPIIKAVRQVSKKTLDVHLMIVKPENYIADFKKAGADYLTVHQEACPHLDRTLHAIKESGMKAGVSLNPSTPVESLREVIGLADLVLVMSVNPGFGGQKFISYATDKVRRLKEMILAQGSSALIEVDGGVNAETGAELIRAGADALVAGNYVFGAADPKQMITTLKKL